MRVTLGPVAAAEPSLGELAVGATLGKYEVLRKLATGGMAELYLVRARAAAGFEKLVVLKRILPTVAGDPEFVQMFLDEARLAATLQHPNIADVYDVGEHAGSYFFTMEFVHGQDARAIKGAARKRGEPVPLAIALAIIHSVASALDYAHARTDATGEPLGLVHRDVSSSNVMVSYDGAIKLLDFGIARASSSTHKTQVGSLKGKIPYMSPEQCKGHAIDRRSDVFSLGVVLYELTVGRRPFRGDSDFAIMDQIVYRGAPRPSELVTGYPEELEAIAMKMLATEVRDRYGNAEEVAHDIEQLMTRYGLWQSPKSVGRYMRSLFGDRIAAWEQAQQQGVPFSEHVATSITSKSQESDLATPPSLAAPQRATPTPLPTPVVVMKPRPSQPDLAPAATMPTVPTAAAMPVLRTRSRSIVIAGVAVAAIAAAVVAGGIRYEREFGAAGGGGACGRAERRAGRAGRAERRAGRAERRAGRAERHDGAAGRVAVTARGAGLATRDARGRAGRRVSRATRGTSARLASAASAPRGGGRSDDNAENDTDRASAAAGHPQARNGDHVGPRLAIVAAVIALAAPRIARADDAADLLKQGLALYKEHKYAEAATTIAKAYDLDPKPETLFPLAQAERLAGDCKSAATHYKQVIEQISDLNVAKLVQENLALCEATAPEPPQQPVAQTPPAAAAIAPPPKIITKTVVREVPTGDRLLPVLAGVGALALGAAGGLAIASSSTTDAADRAGSLPSHDTLADRAVSERDAAIAAAAVGVAVLGYATVRWYMHRGPAKADVAVAPLHGGGAFTVTARW